MFLKIGKIFKGERCIYYHKVKSKSSKTFEMTGKQSLVILLYLLIGLKNLHIFMYLFIYLFIYSYIHAYKSRSVLKRISTVVKNKQINKYHRSNQWDFYF